MIRNGPKRTILVDLVDLGTWAVTKLYFKFRSLNMNSTEHKLRVKDTHRQRQRKIQGKGGPHSLVTKCPFPKAFSFSGRIRLRFFCISLL